MVARSFITGSHAYGTPTEASDIDLVVLVSPETLDILDPGGASDEYGEMDAPSGCFRFGQLNLLCVTSERDYEVWRRGTEELVARKPVARAEAVELFQRLRKEARESEQALLESRS